MVNKKIPPIKDKEIEMRLSKNTLNLTATTNAANAYKKAGYVIIATPTNYDLG